MKLKKIAMTLLGCIFISSCNLVVHVPVRVSKLEANIPSDTNFEISSPVEIRGELSTLLAQFGETKPTSLDSSSSIILNYKIFKSGTRMNLDEYSWGMFYAKNNSVMIFLRKDFLNALKDKIGKNYDTRAITITFEFINDTKRVAFLRVMGAWIDNLPTGHNFESIILKPDSRVLVRISDVSVHYLLLNGVESIATIIFEEVENKTLLSK